MKFLTIVVVFALAVYVKCDTEELVKILITCKEKVEASEEDVTRLMQHSAPKTQTQKCLITCILHGEKILQDGKLSEDGLMEVARKLTNGDAEKMKNVGSIMESCGEVSGDNDCDSGAKIAKCLKDEAEKHQIVLL